MITTVEMSTTNLVDAIPFGSNNYENTSLTLSLETKTWQTRQICQNNIANTVIGKIKKLYMAKHRCLTVERKL